ncbi:MAG: carbon monoxide dehydrogenase subunit G [Candidatus Rariloculaceae bacterium]
MDISGEYRLSLGRQQVWDALLDPEVLRRCIPGCEELEQLEENKYRAKVKTAIGPVKATFTSGIEITNANPPESYRLEGEGKAGVGFGKGYSDVTLEEEGDGTLLRYSAQFQVGGRLAQIGSRLVVSATRKIADDFFSRLTADIDEQAERVVSEDDTGAGGINWALVAVAAAALLAVVWWLAG